MDANVEHEKERRYLKIRIDIAAQLLELTCDESQTHAQKNGSMKLVAKWLREISREIDFRMLGPDDLPF